MASASDPARCTTPRARSTSWISPTSARFATLFGRSSAARCTTSWPSTRRSRGSSFLARWAFAQDQMAATRREPGIGADGREVDAARPDRTPPSDADADDTIGPGGGRPHTARVGDDGLRRGRDRRALELQPARQPTRPTRPSCRASSAPGAMPRDRSFADCIWACRAAGGRRSREDASTFAARCAPAFRPAARRYRRVGCAAHGGRRDSFCWLTAVVR